MSSSLLAPGRTSSRALKSWQLHYVLSSFIRFSHCHSIMESLKWTALFLRMNFDVDSRENEELQSRRRSERAKHVECKPTHFQRYFSVMPYHTYICTCILYLNARLFIRELATQKMSSYSIRSYVVYNCICK